MAWQCASVAGNQRSGNHRTLAPSCTLNSEISGLLHSDCLGSSALLHFDLCTLTSVGLGTGYTSTSDRGYLASYKR